MWFFCLLSWLMVVRIFLHWTARSFCVASAVLCDGWKSDSFIFAGRRTGFLRLLMYRKCELSSCFLCGGSCLSLFFCFFSIVSTWHVFFCICYVPFFVLFCGGVGGGVAIAMFSPRLSCYATCTRARPFPLFTWSHPTAGHDLKKTPREIKKSPLLTRIITLGSCITQECYQSSSYLTSLWERLVKNITHDHLIGSIRKVFVEFSLFNIF